MGFLSRLLDGADESVDSLIFAAVLALVSLTILSIIDVSHDHGFSPIAFGTGAAAIIGSLGGGKALRRIGAKRDGDSSVPAG